MHNAKADGLERSGVKMLYFQEELDLARLIKDLGRMEITSLLIEGGSSLNSHALEDGIVDKVMFFIAPVIVGGRESFPAVGGKTFKRLEEAYRIKGMSVKKIGEDILVEGYIG